MSKYNISTRKLIQLLRKNGFVLTRQSGSHAIFKNEEGNCTHSFKKHPHWHTSFNFERYLN